MYTVMLNRIWYYRLVSTTVVTSKAVGETLVRSSWVQVQGGVFLTGRSRSPAARSRSPRASRRRSRPHRSSPRAPTGGPRWLRAWTRWAPRLAQGVAKRVWAERHISHGGTERECTRHSKTVGHRSEMHHRNGGGIRVLGTKFRG